MGEGATNFWYEVRLAEGRNREIRRMFEAIDVTVSRLTRISYGPVKLGRMTRGSYRFLDHRETAALYRAVGLELPEN
jgi:23S rRNA pseudouridine2605 synthase